MSILRPVDDGSLPWIFVTGGAGYVGSHTVLQLLQDGFSVVVMDNLVNVAAGDGNTKPESLKRVEELTKKTVPFYNVDLSDTIALAAIFAQYTFLGVVHFAALKAVGESCAKPLAYYSNNVSGTINLLQVMNTAGVKNIVFSSSATVYGEPQYLPLDERHPTGQSCTNPYGRTKFFIEEILKDVCTADSAWSALCLRYFNPVGAHPSGRIGEDPQGVPSNLMPFVAQVAVGRRPELRVFGSDYPTIDGTGVRDYIHVMDLAEGHVAAIRKLAASPLGWHAFNLGLGVGYSVLQVVQAFEKASKRPIPVQLSERRPGDVAACYANCSLAEQELGWRASRDLDAMCADMWCWQLANPTGFLTTR